MRTIIVVLCLLLPLPAVAAIAYVQEAHVSGIGVSFVNTGDITTTNGNLIVCTGSHYADSLFAITDSKSNSYTTSIGELTSSADSNTHLTQQYSNNITGGATHNFTWTFNTAGDVDFSCIEVSGQATTDVLDRTASKIDNSGTSHTSSATANTTQNDEILVGAGMLGAFFCECTFTAGGSFTERVNITTSFGVTVGQIIATRVISAAGAYSFTFTTDASETGAIGAISTWKAPLAAPTIRKRGAMTLQ